MKLFSFLSFSILMIIALNCFSAGEKEITYQAPITLSPSFDTGYNYAITDKAHDLSVSPGISLTTSMMTSSGYKVNVNAGANFTWKECLFEAPVDSTSSLRQYDASFNLGLSTAFTEKLKGSLSGSFAIARPNAYENYYNTLDDKNVYGIEGKISFSGVPNTPISISSKMTVSEYKNSPLTADPIREGVATGEGPTRYLGDTSVFPTSVYSPSDIYGYNYGDSTFAYAQVVEPTVGNVNDISLNMFKFDIGQSFENQMIPTVKFNFVLNMRSSNNIKRDKWGQTGNLSASASYWENGSLDAAYTLSRSGYITALASDKENKREDYYNELSLTLAQTVIDKISLSMGYTYYKNTSNKDESRFFGHEMNVSSSVSF